MSGRALVLACLALLLAPPGGAVAGDDCEAGGDAGAGGSPLAIAPPLLCSGSVGATGDAADPYSFTAAADAPVRVWMDADFEIALVVRAPSWTADAVFFLQKGALTFTDATAGTWTVKPAHSGSVAGYDLQVTTRLQDVTGRVLLAHPGPGLAEDGGPASLANGTDGQWIKLAAPTTANEWVTLTFPSTTLPDLDVHFYDAAFAPLAGGCASRVGSGTETCVPPAGAHWALVTGPLAVATDYRLTYHH